VEIDGDKVTALENCKITRIDAGKDSNSLSFEQLDAALPFFPPEAAKILEWAPILEDLNDYHLKVNLNKDATYQVQLDGKAIGSWKGSELAKGVNIAAAVLKAGPIADQVKAVKEAVEKKNSYHHDKIFRGIVLTNSPEWVADAFKTTPQEVEAKREALLAERFTKLEELDKAVRSALEMKPHKVTIVRAPE
jgi:hypothetical protein